MSNFSSCWEKDIESKEGIKILPEDYIPKNLKIGEKYHLSWASNKGMVWCLRSYNAIYAFLETPRSKKQLISKISDIRELNRNALINAKLRIKSYENKRFSIINN